jgi:undecaprenyl-diphosphatase
MYILFFVQLIAEMFPISSSGHVFLLNRAFDLLYPLTDFYNYVAHFPSFVIVFFFFLGDILEWLKKISLSKALYVLICLFVVVLFPVIAKFAIDFFELDVFYKIPLWIGFTITSVILFSSVFYLDNYRDNQSKNVLEAKDILILGAIQVFSLLPGISRFASTFATAKLLGFSRIGSIYITAALGAILQLGGSAVAFLIYFFKPSLVQYCWESSDLIAFPFAFVIAAIGYAFVIGLYKRGMQWIFGIYEVCIALYAYFL